MNHIPDELVVEISTYLSYISLVRFKTASTYNYQLLKSETRKKPLLIKHYKSCDKLLCNVHISELKRKPKLIKSIVRLSQNILIIAVLYTPLFFYLNIYIACNYLINQRIKSCISHKLQICFITLVSLCLPSNILFLIWLFYFLVLVTYYFSCILVLISQKINSEILLPNYIQPLFCDEHLHFPLGNI